MLTWIQSMDELVLLWIQENLRGALDGAVVFYSNLGAGGVLWILISLLLIAKKSTRRAGITALVSMGVCFVINNLLIKNIVCRPRPFVTMDEISALLIPSDQGSFPSGHACSSFAVTSVWCRMLKQRWLKVLLVGLAVLMALSRLYVGVHYPSDIIVGALIGTVGGQLIYLGSEKVMKLREKRKNTSE